MHPTHPGRRPWPTVLLLVVTALLLALFAVVLVAPPVGAHPLGGVQSSNYQARVLAVRPPVPGLTVAVVDAGSRLRLVNTGPRDVVVLGYQLEPWLRVGPRGVFENSRSPTLQMAGPRRADSPPPAAVDPGAPTSWRQVDAGQSVAWHDHRAHWEADEPPTQVRRAPGSTHVVIPQWTVKLRSGGRLVDVVGEVRWVPGPSPLPWLAGAALLAMAVVAVGRTRRWSDALVAALALVVGPGRGPGGRGLGGPPGRQAAVARGLGGRVGGGRAGHPPAAAPPGRERPVPAPARRRAAHRRGRPRGPGVPVPLPARQHPPRLGGPRRRHRQDRPRPRRPDRRRPAAPRHPGRPGRGGPGPARGRRPCGCGRPRAPRSGVGYAPPPGGLASGARGRRRPRPGGGWAGPGHGAALAGRPSARQLRRSR